MKSMHARVAEAVEGAAQRPVASSSVGVGFIWDSPLGPLRFDLAYPLSKYCATPRTGGTQVCDITQVFRFSGGTRF